MNFDTTRANYICVYFDLLGVRADLFKKISGNDDDTDKTINEWSAVVRAFMINVGRIVTAYRSNPGKTFDNFFSQMGNPDPNARDNFIKGCKSLNLGFQQFSDTSMFYLRDVGELSMIVVREIMLLLVPHIIDAMQHKVVLRGCMAVGDGWLIDKDCLFGPVIEQCYNIEEKHTGYPRIVCTDAFIELCRNVRSHLDGNKKSEFSMFIRDYDGQYVFDYLNPVLLRMSGVVGNKRELKNLLGNVRAFTLDRYVKKLKACEYELAEKYYHLLQYVDHSIEIACKNRNSKERKMP